MLKAYKYRIYPSEKQKLFLNQWLGCCRFIYNITLDHSITSYKENKTPFNYNALATTFLKQQKQDNPWLKDCPAQPLQQSILHLKNSYKGFFKLNKGFPKFKSKSNKNSIHFPQNTKVDFKRSKLFLPKVKDGILTRFHRFFEGDIRSSTLTKVPSGKYFISILVEDGKEMPIKPSVDPKKSIGIDLGIKSYLTFDNGSKIDNPKIIDQYSKRDKLLSKRLSSKTKGSKNRTKARIKLAKLREKVKNSRVDFLHKLSSKIIRENQSIIVEDLSIKSMMENNYSSCNKAIQDASWSEFVRMLSYKSDFYGKNLIKIDRYDPTSKLCSTCHYKNDTLKLKDRKWICMNCCTIHDRDINAAKNIKSFGLAKSGLEQSEEPVEQKQVVFAKKQEAYSLVL